MPIRSNDLNSYRFSCVKGDIENLPALSMAADGCDVILHEAAQGSVPLSLENPLQTHASNATGFIHVLEAARARGIQCVVYALSSAFYGDCPEQPLFLRAPPWP